VVEETTSVLSRDHGDRSTNGLNQSFPSSSFGLAHKSFDLRKRFLYGIEVRRIGRHIKQLITSLLDELPNSLSFVSCEVVHHHLLSGTQRGRQDLFYICLEDLAVGRVLHGKR
jgi:hypothetical protein